MIYIGLTLHDNVTKESLLREMSRSTARSVNVEIKVLYCQNIKSQQVWLGTHSVVTQLLRNYYSGRVCSNLDKNFYNMGIIIFTTSYCIIFRAQCT